MTRKPTEQQSAEQLIAKALAFSYLRFSSPQQAAGDSVRRQDALRDAWLARSGAILDTSLTLRDEGISAFAGKHRSNPDRYALACFLDLVQRGRIPRGSFLVVESLDRLSREHIRPALTLLLNLIEAGIRVVQLLPIETVYDENVEPMTLMMAIMELSRGHSESAMKSERVGGAWRQKKLDAARDRRPLTARAPAWLQLDGGLKGGKWRFVEPAASIVRRIVRWATEGYGIGVICKKLNAEGVEALGVGKQKAEHWARSSVAKLTSHRGLIGEYQPYTGRGDKRRPDGEPVPNYFPALITEDEWYAMRAAMTSRRQKPGRAPKGELNLFTGILKDAWTGSGMHLRRIGHKGPKNDARSIVPYKGVLGAGSKTESFPLDIFERAVLSKLREIKPRDILPSSDAPDKALAAEGKVKSLQARIKKIKATLENEDEEDGTSSLAEVLRSLDGKLATATAELDAANREAASPLSAAWAEYGTLLDVLDKSPNPEETRVRLRSVLRRMVEGVWCLFTSQHITWRIAAVQIQFAGGAHRDYLILYKRGGTLPGKSWPSRMYVCSFADVADDDSLDLRKKKDAKRLETELQRIDVEAWANELR